MSNTPTIRFKGFSDDWELRKFEDIFSVSQGLQIPIKDRFTEDGNNRYFYITNEFLKDSCSETYYIESPSESVICDEEDILMTRTGNTGIIVTDVNGCFHNNFFKIKYDKTVFSKRFICYLLSSPMMQKIILNSAGSSTIPDLSHKNFYKISSRFPCSKNEQNSVGNFLFHLDHLITLHQQKCNDAKLLKKYMLKKMFPQNGQKVPEIRFSGFTDDWEQRKLPEFVSFFNGLTYTPDDVEETGTLVLRSSNVKNGEIIDADNVYVNDKVATSENVQEGDIIVVVRNGSRALIGKHAQIKVSMPNTVIGAFMSGMRSEHSSFVNALLDTSAFENEIAKNMGATINQITGYMFSKMEFMIPSGEEQQQIGEYFQSLDNLITLHQQKCDKLKEMKKYMLQNMFPQKG